MNSELKARLLMSLVEERMVALYSQRIGPQLANFYLEEVVTRPDLSAEERAILAMRCAMQGFALASAMTSLCRGSHGPLGRDQAPFFREVMEEIINRMEDGAVEEMRDEEQRGESIQ